MKKRILSIVLAIAMAATLAPVSGLVSSNVAKADALGDVVYTAQPAATGGAPPNTSLGSFVDGNSASITLDPVAGNVTADVAVDYYTDDSGNKAAGGTYTTDPWTVRRVDDGTGAGANLNVEAAFTTTTSKVARITITAPATTQTGTYVYRLCPTDAELNAPGIINPLLEERQALTLTIIVKANVIIRDADAENGAFGAHRYVDDSTSGRKGFSAITGPTATNWNANKTIFRGETTDFPVLESMPTHWFYGFNVAGQLNVGYLNNSAIVGANGTRNVESIYNARYAALATDGILIDWSGVRDSIHVTGIEDFNLEQRNFSVGTYATPVAITSAMVNGANYIYSTAVPVAGTERFELPNFRTREGVGVTGYRILTGANAGTLINGRVLQYTNGNRLVVVAPVFGSVTNSAVNLSHRQQVEYGETVQAQIGIGGQTARYIWHAGIVDVNGNVVNDWVIQDQVKGTANPNADKLIIADGIGLNAGGGQMIWNFRNRANGGNWGVEVTNGQNLNRSAYRVWCVVDGNESQKIIVTNNILDRHDFYYGYNNNQHVQIDWTTLQNTQFDPGLTGQNPDGTPNGQLRMLEALYDDGYEFDVVYRAADQALDVVGAGSYPTQAARLEGGALVRDFYTFDELRDLEHAASYLVYVVNIRKDANGIPGDNAGIQFLNPRTNVTVTARNTASTLTASRGIQRDAYELKYDPTEERYLEGNTNTTTLVTETPVANALTGADNGNTDILPALNIGTLEITKGFQPGNVVVENKGGLSGARVGSRFGIRNAVYAGQIWYDATTGVNLLSEIQWFRQDTSGNKTDITGATGDEYTATADDVGYIIGVRVGHFNWSNTYEGFAMAEPIAKTRVPVFVNENINGVRDVHFVENGTATVDMTGEIIEAINNLTGDDPGAAEADVTFDMKGHGTFSAGKFDAKTNSIVLTMRPQVPTTFARYDVEADVQYKGYIVELRGGVRGTPSDIYEVKIDPIATKEYDGMPAAKTTAKAYKNGEEITDATISITYSDLNGGDRRSVPQTDAGTYLATATWVSPAGTKTDSVRFRIRPRQLVAKEGSIQLQYNVGDRVPGDYSRYNMAPQFNVVSTDTITIENIVREFAFHDATTATPQYSHVFYTPRFAVGNGTYYMHFVIGGTNADRNYIAPAPMAIKVGTGLGNADPNNPGVTPATPADPLDADFVEGGVYRLYSPVTGEHLFTTDFREYKALANGKSDPAAKWQAEKASFITAKADDKDALAVYRFYNVNGEGHVYTYDKREIAALKADPNWSDDNNGKAAFYALKATTDTTGTVDVYRIYNPADGQHLMTADKREMNYNVTEKGWMYDTADGTAQVYAKMIAVK